MKKRILFVGSGIVLLGFGITGLALIRTAPYSEPQSLAEHQLSESPPDETQQASAEGNLSTEVGVETSAGQQSQESEKPVPLPQVGKSLRRYPNQNQLAQPSLSNRKPQARTGPTASNAKHKNIGNYPRETFAPAKGVVTVRLSLNPVRNKHIRVARVHAGDRVMIRIHRVGEPRGRVYLAFNTFENFMSGPYDHSIASAAVITPIKDDDRLILKSSHLFGPELSRRLESKEGAVLELGTGSNQYRGPWFYPARYEPGCFEIEIKLYAGNRWNMRPRSLL